MVNLAALKEVILENRSEVMRHKVLPRNFSLDSFPRQVLVGVRRAGKSYLLYDKIQRLIHNDGKTWDDILYLNFEDERIWGMQHDDLNKILEVFGTLSDKRPILFLDEIQNVEGWQNFARRLADNKFEMYITGSNAKMLGRDIEKDLGARFVSHQIYPYNYQEYLNANGLNINSPEFMTTTASRSSEARLRDVFFSTGGFPEIATQPAKHDYLISLYQKIFLGDIATRNKIDNIFTLRMLYKKLAESVGQPLSFTRAANIIKGSGVKISTDTVIRFVEYAIEACLIYSIHNFAAVLSEREGNPKYYFVDNGIMSLLSLPANLNLFENVVAMELIKKLGNSDGLYFYKNGIEVDFYLPDHNMAIQVAKEFASSDTTRDREIKALEVFNKRFPGTSNFIITNDYEEVIHSKNVEIQAIPFTKFVIDFKLT